VKNKIIYTDAYLVDIGDHVFPTEKYKMVRDLLVKNDGFKKEDFVRPSTAKDEDVLLVHTKAYLDKLKCGRLSVQEQLTLELPYSAELVSASLLCVEGSIMAAKIALKDMVGIHLGGGFHHAFPDHGEGFCVFNDVAIAIRRLRKDGLIKKAMVIDCDLHHGNGTACIFQKDDDTFTFSIHQENNYPFLKPASNLDIGLQDGAGDEMYLEGLHKNIPEIIEEFKPDFIIYVAGADPYRKDQIGNLGLSVEGLKKRDEFIFEMCNKFNVPVAVVLAGGYAINKEDTARIHYNTVKTGLRYAS
jgi:acetoin utilization deacetylase AcuC-like enzyme